VTGSCATSTTSLFFPGEAGCNTTSAFGDRTCAWGLRRVLAGERLIIVSGDGRWTHAGFDATGALEEVGTAKVFAAKLAASWTPADWPDPPAPSLPVTMPNETAGQGWVATLDRVFFTLDAATNTLQRIQCTGDPDPANANWPPPTATAIPASLTYTPTGGTATSCGPFEVVARHVDSVTFSYFDASDSAVDVATLTTGAAKRGVRRIAWRIQFRQPIDGRDVVYDVAGTARLQNL
jgi:hypothetical protein